jgi:hypothetical protein
VKVPARIEDSLPSSSVKEMKRLREKTQRKARAI